MHLYIGNKLYSSWSLRPWLAMKALDIAFDETLIPFTAPDFKERALTASGSGLVPALVDGDVTVWESLAILEYLADKFPDRNVWPEDAKARAHARSMAAEMHVGFLGIRSACPMNLGKRFAHRDRGEAVLNDVFRFSLLAREARKRFGKPAGGPFLYGAFSAADAMYAPLVTRLDTYSIFVDDETQDYMNAVLEHDAMQEWLGAALKEDWIFDADEVDEPAIENLRPHLAE